MKTLKLLLVFTATLVVGTLAFRTLADDSSEVSLTGWMVCGKCTLHITKQCQNVLQVPENGTTNNYFLVMNSVSTDFHTNICTTDGEKATVTGTVEEKDGKSVLTPTSIVAAK